MDGYDLRNFNKDEGGEGHFLKYERSTVIS